MDNSHSRTLELMSPPVAGSSFSLYQNNPTRHRQYGTEAWDVMKPLIKKFYIDDNLSLRQLMEMLSEEHDFHPTSKMFKRKFELWKFAKNITSKNASPLFNQKMVADVTGRLTTLGPHGRPVVERRLRKYFKRRRWTPLNPMPSMQNLSTSNNTTSTTTTSHRELSDLPDTYPEPHDLLPGDGASYEQDCPYRVWTKKFRFSETYPDGWTYQEDSFGHGLYIQVEGERPCSSHCFCRKHHLQKAFTFEIHKFANQLQMTIYSHSLYDELVTHIPWDYVDCGLGYPTRTVNGLALLRHYHVLMRRLKDLRSALYDNPANKSLVLEMDLLVNGFLGDGQLFRSFGYENLYECGLIDYQLWKYFQKQKLEKDITEFDESFSAIDDKEALPTSDSQSGSATTFVGETLADGATEDMIEPLIDAGNEIQEKVARPAGTDNPEVYISTSLHVKDGPDAHEYSCPSAASDSSLLPDSGANVNGTSPMSHWKLSRAIRAGRAGHLRWLLKHGADVNQTDLYRIPLLVEAVDAGHKGIVRLLLDSGADVNATSPSGDGPLYRAIQTRHEGIVWLLLDRGADVNWTDETWLPPLLQAVMAGHEGIVRLLLDHGANINETDVKYGGTALHLAMDQHNEGVMRLLLDRGANIDALSSTHTALSMAAMNRNVSWVRQLIREGADVQTAAICLQGKDRNHMQWLLKVACISSIATSVSKKKSWQSADSDASENIRHVGLKFVKQYMLMTGSTQKSRTILRDLPQQLHSHREAWTAAIETMRGLTRGEKPQGVHKTLAFLSLGRAIAETLRDRKNCDYIEDFEQDLGRWGQLFTIGEDIEAYEEALNLMWGVVCNKYTSRERRYVDEDTLIRFQELASTLVGHANDLLGIDTFQDRSWEHYQRSQPKIDQTPVEESSDRSSDHQSPAAESPSKADAPPLQHLNSSNLFDSMKTDTSSFEPVVLLLVAGAIFAVVVIFLEALRQKSNCFALHRIGTLQERYWVLAAYLGLGDTGTRSELSPRMVSLQFVRGFASALVA